MAPEVRFAIWMGVTAGVLTAAAYGVWRLRKWLLEVEEEARQEDEIYTTAQLESLKRQGLLDEGQYEKLKNRSEEAAKRRAEAAGKRDAEKTGLFS